MDTIGDKLTDPAFFAANDPHPLWKRMRAEDPVHWATGNLSKGFWSITRYEDALRVLRDPITFSSEALGMSMPTRELEDIDRSDLGCGAMIIAMDPPRHNPMRRALSGNFLRSHIGQWEARCRRVVAELIDRVAPIGQCDFVRDVAEQLPMLMILEMMEIPPEDRATLLRWAAMTVGNDDPEFQVGSSLDSRRQGNFAIYDYSRRLALKRRGGAGSDLLTAMGNAIVMGEHLTEHELPPTRKSVGARFGAETRWSSGRRRPTAMRRSLPTRTASISRANPTSISPSVTASTSAWARIWRVWNCAPCCKSCCAVCPTSNWPARLSGCIQSSCSDPSTCRSSSRRRRHVRSELFSFAMKCVVVAYEERQSPSPTEKWVLEVSENVRLTGQ
jgi:hypothetical protein